MSARSRNRHPFPKRRKACNRAFDGGRASRAGRRWMRKRARARLAQMPMRVLRQWRRLALYLGERHVSHAALCPFPQPYIPSQRARRRERDARPVGRARRSGTLRVIQPSACRRPSPLHRSEGQRASFHQAGTSVRRPLLSKTAASVAEPLTGLCSPFAAGSTAG
jgi:hypothetical protein